MVYRKIQALLIAAVGDIAASVNVLETEMALPGAIRDT